MRPTSVSFNQGLVRVTRDGQTGRGRFPAAKIRWYIEVEAGQARRGHDTQVSTVGLILWLRPEKPLTGH